MSINYALGTDSVARGDLDTARDYYDRTFTDDALIQAGFDPSAPGLSATGPDEWTEVVAQAFIPYSNTQHLLASINVELARRRRSSATMTTYLQATHVYRDRLELLTVLGTYIDTVEFQRRVGWRITQRFLQFTSFNTTVRTQPPISE